MKKLFGKKTSSSNKLGVPSFSGSHVNKTPNVSLGSTIISARLHQGGVSYLLDSRISSYYYDNPNWLMDNYEDEHEKYVNMRDGDTKMVLLLSGDVKRWKEIKRNLTNVNDRAAAELCLKKMLRKKGHDSDLILCEWDTVTQTHFNSMVYGNGIITSMPFTIAGSGSDVVYPEAALHELRNLQSNNDWSTIVDHKAYWSNLTVGAAQRSLLDIGIYSIDEDPMCGYPVTLGNFMKNNVSTKVFFSNSIPRWWYTTNYYDENVFELTYEPSVFPTSYETQYHGYDFIWNGTSYEKVVREDNNNDNAEYGSEND